MYILMYWGVVVANIGCHLCGAFPTKNNKGFKVQ